MKINNENGFTITTSVVVVAMVVLISASLLTLVMNQLSATERYGASVRALYAARRGIEVAYTNINRGRSGNLNRAIDTTTSYRTTFLAGTGLLKSTGIVRSRGKSDNQNIERTVSVKLTPRENKFKETFSTNSYQDIAVTQTATWEPGQISAPYILPIICNFNSKYGLNGSISDIHFFDDLNGVLVFNLKVNYDNPNVLIYKTYDGGNNWVQKLDIPNSVGITAHEKSFEFINNQTGFLCLSLQSREVAKNLIYKTSNGGETWKPVYSGIADAWFQISDIDFPTPQTGYAVGTRLMWSYGNPAWDVVALKTTNGGESWSRITAPGGSYYTAVSFIDANNGKIAYQSQGASGVPIEVGLYSTTNGGANWVRTYYSNSQSEYPQINNLEVKYTPNYWWTRNMSDSFQPSGSVWKNTSTILSVPVREMFWENASTAYLAGRNRRTVWGNNDYSGHIYTTTNNGATWKDIRTQTSDCSTVSSSPYSSYYWATSNSQIMRSPIKYVTGNSYSNNRITTTLPIKAVKIIPDRIDKSSALVNYYIATGTSSWVKVDFGKWVDLVNEGTTLKWRAELIPDENSSPVLNGLTIYYTSGYAKDYSTWRTD